MLVDRRRELRVLELSQNFVLQRLTIWQRVIRRDVTCRPVRFDHCGELHRAVLLSFSEQRIHIDPINERCRALREDGGAKLWSCSRRSPSRTRLRLRSWPCARLSGRTRAWRRFGRLAPRRLRAWRLRQSIHGENAGKCCDEKTNRATHSARMQRTSHHCATPISLRHLLVLERSGTLARCSSWKASITLPSRFAT